MATMRRVTAFIDWDTARRVVRSRYTDVRSIESVFDRLQISIAAHLGTRSKKDAFRVYWRVYHGWHQGRTKTSDRLIFERYILRATARTVDNVSFSSDYTLSGTLSCSSRRAPLVDTHRLDRDTGETRQKMVDTMLICDLLHLARARDSELLVVANDDDFVPALYTAEAWNANVMLLHNRDHTNQFLELDGLVERMRFE